MEHHCREAAIRAGSPCLLEVDDRQSGRSEYARKLTKQRRLAHYDRRRPTSEGKSADNGRRAGRAVILAEIRRDPGASDGTGREDHRAPNRERQQQIGGGADRGGPDERTVRFEERSDTSVTDVDVHQGIELCVECRKIGHHASTAFGRISTSGSKVAPGVCLGSTRAMGLSRTSRASRMPISSPILKAISPSRAARSRMTASWDS